MLESADGITDVGPALTLNWDILLKKIVEVLPEGPAYFDKDEDMSNRNVRFFVTEMVRTHAKTEDAEGNSLLGGSSGGNEYKESQAIDDKNSGSKYIAP